MRHATWQRIEGSPLLHRAYRKYRRLPDPIRATMRALVAPDWIAATWYVRNASHSQVVSGPFKGMKLNLSPLSARHLLGYILGTQELELSDIIESIAAKRYGTIINVGAADGYYAVGLALRSPESQVIGFEALPELHPVVVDTARANGVAERISLRGKCEVPEFRSELAKAARPALVVMDIEGGEATLLDPSVAPELCGVDILVETHDMYAKDVTAKVIERFKATHTVEHRTSRERSLSDFPSDFAPALPRFFPKLAVDLMDERRAGVQDWLYLVANSEA
jgi:hypothetical protein